MLSPDEVRRRVVAAFYAARAEFGPGPRQDVIGEAGTVDREADAPSPARHAPREWTLREMARLIAPRLDQDVVDGLFHEGLMRRLRRSMRLRARRKNREKQAEASRTAKTKAIAGE
jgi:hypothetical protein